MFYRCYSFIGRTRRSGAQRISLAPGCVRYGFGTAVHEMMHALGFFHEQSRTDRDRFVRIAWENIRAGMEMIFPFFSLFHLHGYGIIIVIRQKRE